MHVDDASIICITCSTRVRLVISRVNYAVTLEMHQWKCQKSTRMDPHCFVCAIS